MKKALAILILLCPSLTSAQLWNNVLNSSRAVDWSATSPGVVGGVPSAGWAQCGTTISAYGSAATPASPATIQNALNACAANHYVKLGPGTFYLNDEIFMVSNVVLRGSGADGTTIVYAANATQGAYACTGLGAQVCFKDSTGMYYGGGNVLIGNTNSATWTGTNATNGTYTQNATSIRLTNVGAAGIINGMYITLDQNNDNPATASTFGTGLLICDNRNSTDGCSLESGAPGRCSNPGSPTINPCVGGVHRNLAQTVKVTAGCAVRCTGAGPFDITITPGIYGKKWATGFSPGAFWASDTAGVNGIQNSGLEDLTIDNSAITSTAGIHMQNAYNCWVTGVRSIDPKRNHVYLYQSSHNTIANNYFYTVQNPFTEGYGVEFLLATDNLVINNIAQKVQAPIIFGNGQGNVISGNFGINMLYGQANWMQQGIASGHDGGTVYNLFENNIINGVWHDVFHGTGGLNTFYRNVLTGWEPGKTQETVPVQFFSYNRFNNLIANVLGCRNTTSNWPGNCGAPYHTTYQTSGGVGQAASIYDFNAGNTEPGWIVLADSYTSTSTMRWGNFDVKNNSTQFNAGEVPTALADGYSVAVPTTSCTNVIACPNSFYNNTQPSYWGPLPWPAIGPDVTGGTLPGYGGHAYQNPAARCYFTNMAGDQAGTGGPYTFNANACYAAAQVTPPAAPTNLAATVVNSNANLTWNASTGSPSGYSVFRATVSGGPYTQIANNVAGTSYSDQNLAGGTYYYVVRAFNSAGSSGNSNQITVVIPSGVSIPGIPQNVSATPTGSNISITWTQSTGTPTSDKIFRGTTNGGPYTLLSNLALTTSYTDTGLAAGTYYYVVQGCNSAGCSANSAQASATIVSLVPALNVNPSIANFGNVALGQTSANPATLTITNLGTGNLVLASSSCITLSGPNAADFTIVSSPACPTTIAPNMTASITINFTPSIVGTETASLVILSNDPNSPDTVSLSGTGFNAISVDKTSLSFGNQYINKTSATQTVTLSNASGGTITLSSIALTGGDAAMFAIVNHCGGTLGGSSSCTVDVTFTPTSNGGKSTTLRFTYTGAGGSPINVPITGTGSRKHILKVGAAVSWPYGGADIIKTVWKRPWSSEELFIDAL